MRPGNSGATITKAGERIRKESEEGKKLQISIEKQIWARLPEPLQTPKVHTSGYQMASMFGDQPEVYSAEMDFIDGAAIWEAKDWKRRIDNVIEWVADNIRRSTETVPKADILTYLNQLDAKARSVGQPYHGIVHSILESGLHNLTREAFLPIGDNHGDLTFTNMIAAKEATYLIDFDQGALNTPYYDLAKLEQDALCGWYRRFFPNPTFGDSLDKHVIGRLAQFKGYQQWRSLLLGIALSRILIRNKHQASTWVKCKCKLFS
jgi:hypothetical protein